MGRKPVLDQVKRGQICAMIVAGCSRRTAAHHVGCAVSTITNTAMHDRAFREQLREAESEREVGPLRNLQAHAAKNWRAAAWLLERTHPENYVRRPHGTIDRQVALDVLRDAFLKVIEDIPQGEVRDRICKRIDERCAWVERQLQAEAARMSDGRRRRRR